MAYEFKQSEIDRKITQLLETVYNTNLWSSPVKGSTSILNLNTGEWVDLIEAAKVALTEDYRVQAAAAASRGRAAQSASQAAEAAGKAREKVEAETTALQSEIGALRTNIMESRNQEKSNRVNAVAVVGVVAGAGLLLLLLRRRRK